MTTTLPTGLAVRVARAADAAVLPDIEASAAQAFRATRHWRVADEAGLGPGAYLGLIDSGVVYVAEDVTGLVGFIAARPLAGALHIQELAVRRERQRQGIASALIAAARRGAIESGLASLTLTTFADVPFNAPFYRRLGFEVMASPSVDLAAILKDEAARGLVHRCAMRLQLAAKENRASVCNHFDAPSNDSEPPSERDT